MKISSLFILALLSIVACKDDEYKFVPVNNTSLVLVAPPANNVVLNTDTPNAQAINLVWNDNTGAGGNYTIESAIDEMFTVVYPLGTSTSPIFSLTMAQLSAKLSGLGLSPYVGTTIFIRINNGKYKSNVVSYNVTTYPTGNPKLTAPTAGTAFVPNSNAPTATATTITWSDFDNSSSGTSITYVIQAALSGTNFATPVVVGTVTSTSPSSNKLILTNADLNNLALASGIVAGQKGSVDLRIVATIKTASGTSIVRNSDPIAIMVTPYNINYPNLFFVGNASIDGWNNNKNNTPVFRDPTDPSIFTYTGYFNQGSFKMLEVLGQWQPQWGSNDGGATLAVNKGSGSDPGTIEVATEGYYTYTFDLAGDTGTITVAPFNATASPVYPTMELIGAAVGGWSTGIPMTALANDKHIWYATNQTFVDGPFKFRTDNTWTYNWGVASSELYGKATLGAGDNMSAVAGKYDVWFNDLTGNYILIKK